MKKLIQENLRKLAEDVNISQDYNAEFNQTGSGKSIKGKPNLPDASRFDVAKIRAKITQAHQIAKAYREAYQKGLNAFDVIWQGNQYTCKIPKGFREKTNLAGEKTDYLYYFEYPNVGDGGFQVSMDKTGFMRAKHIRAKADMDQNPKLAAATDAGYQKDYEGRTKYFFVQAGVRGKFQEDGYSIFPSPAMDAAVKTLISFQTDIIDFMSGALGYTSDTKGKDLANNMNLEDKIKKVRLDAERQLNVGKSLAFNPVWSAFRESLLKKYAGETSVFNFDINSEVEAFVETFKNKNPFNPSGKPELAMPKDEMDAWEKEQKEKLARLTAARARKR